MADITFLALNFRVTVVTAGCFLAAELVLVVKAARFSVRAGYIVVVLVPCRCLGFLGVLVVYNAEAAAM